ncbi:MAG: reactive intermediate/imine deaminase [Flavobacteriaceae bacterium]|nr:reactive intermediate/imine deaminase [Flavobacteriaceae bacterium]|tara:strand:+ start:287 stop:799 length:513 start_codon:yes stop_codon:yes gene_type:complete
MKIIRLAIAACLVCNFLGCDETKKEATKEPNEIISKVKFEKQEVPVFHKSHEPKKENAPFSDVVQVGNTFYLSGQIGMDHTTRELVAGGIKAETAQALENIKAVLAQHSLEMKDVIKATVILDTIEDFSVFNEIYTQYFPQKPARTTFAAEALAKGATIEIEVVAVSGRQ